MGCPFDVARFNRANRAILACVVRGGNRLTGTLAQADPPIHRAEPLSYRALSATSSGDQKQNG